MGDDSTTVLELIEARTSDILEAAAEIETTFVDIDELGAEAYTIALGFIEATSRRIYGLKKTLLDQAVEQGRRNRPKPPTEEGEEDQ